MPLLLKWIRDRSLWAPRTATTRSICPFFFPPPHLLVFFWFLPVTPLFPLSGSSTDWTRMKLTLHRLNLLLAQQILSGICTCTVVKCRVKKQLSQPPTGLRFPPLSPSSPPPPPPPALIPTSALHALMCCGRVFSLRSSVIIFNVGVRVRQCPFPPNEAQIWTFKDGVKWKSSLSSFSYSARVPGLTGLPSLGSYIKILSFYFSFSRVFGLLAWQNNDIGRRRCALGNCWRQKHVKNKNLKELKVRKMLSTVSGKFLFTFKSAAVAVWVTGIYSFLPPRRPSYTTMWVRRSDDGSKSPLGGWSGGGVWGGGISPFESRCSSETPWVLRSLNEGLNLKIRAPITDFLVKRKYLMIL